MTLKASSRTLPYQSFADWAQATRQAEKPPSQAELKQVARQFQVPLADAQAVREELLKKQSGQLDDAGHRSKGLRKESQGGLPQGMVKAKGIGAAAALVKGAPVVDKPLKLPAGFDARQAVLFNAVPLKSSDPQLKHIELLQLSDGGKHRFDVQVGVPAKAGEAPTITLRLYDDKGSPGRSGGLNPELAATLLPILDVATSRSQVSDGPKLHAGRAVLHEVLAAAEVLVAAKGGAPREAEHKAIEDAAVAFDKGQHANAEGVLAKLATTSPHGDVRARAHFLLGDMVARFGRTDEAIHHVITAFPRLSRGGQVQAQNFLAHELNTQREFPRAEHFARGAIREGLALRDQGQKLDLGSAWFALGFALKNQGKMDEAVEAMRGSLKERPQSTATALALAGYLAMAGKKDEAQKLFASIPVPPRDQLAHIDYHSNAAWFAGVSRDKPAVLASVANALDSAKRLNFAGTLNYFQTEPDLDWLRADKDFQALLARYSA